MHLQQFSLPRNAARHFFLKLIPPPPVLVLVRVQGTAAGRDHCRGGVPPAQVRYSRLWGGAATGGHGAFGGRVSEVCSPAPFNEGATRCSHNSHQRNTFSDVSGYLLIQRCVFLMFSQQHKKVLVHKGFER